MLIVGFADFVRKNIHGPTTKDQLTHGAVNSAISGVVSTFRQNLRPDPTLDKQGQRCVFLQRLLKGYKDDDPATKSQACIPLTVFEHMLKQAKNSKFDTAISQLIIGALFFAMRSCEYSTVKGTRKTKRLTLGDIRFYKLIKGYNQEIKHSSPEIANADVVSITFIKQKNGEKESTITQHQSNNKLCPVKAWAAIIARIRAYKSSTDSTPVNTFMKGKSMKQFTATQIKDYLQLMVCEVGTDRLGINVDRIGTHSLRTSAAMLLYLAEVRVSTIMLLGRWKSDAFLLYLRRQVKEFTAGVTEAMTSQPNMFLNILSIIKSDPDDPRTPHLDSIASINRHNGTTKDKSSRLNPIFAEAMHVWG